MVAREMPKNMFNGNQVGKRARGYTGRFLQRCWGHATTNEVVEGIKHICRSLYSLHSLHKSVWSHRPRVCAVTAVRWLPSCLAVLEEPYLLLSQSGGCGPPQRPCSVNCRASCCLEGAGHSSQNWQLTGLEIAMNGGEGDSYTPKLSSWARLVGFQSWLCISIIWVALKVIAAQTTPQTN